MYISRYNRYYKYNGILFVFNLLSKSILEVDPEIFHLLNHNLIEELFNLSTPELDILFNEQILFKDKEEERIQLLKHYYSIANDNETATLFVSLTKTCNMACNYCYQDFREENSMTNNFLSDENIKQLKKFVENLNIQNLGLVYFGGEPTCNLVGLIKLIQEMNCIQGITVYNSLISNGSILSEELLNEINNCNNFSVQITIDGPQFLHDSHRIYKDGSGTFSDIYSNLRYLAYESTCRIMIRINIKTANRNEYEEFLLQLWEDFGTRILINFHLVFDGQRKKNKNQASIDFIRNLEEYAIDLGLNVSYDIGDAPCILHAKNGYTLDENLKLYQCPGSLYGRSIGEIDSERMSAFYHSSDTYPPIRQCVYLCKNAPICYGGCILSNFRCKKNELNQRINKYVEFEINKYLRERG